MASLDATNLALLAHLQRDARCTVADLARRVGKSEATVRDRVRNLESRGTLTGYHAQVDLDCIGIAVAAHVGVELDYEDLPRLRRELGAIPHVASAQVVTGDQSLRLCLVARDLSDLERVLQKRLGPLGLGRLHAEVVVEEIVPPRPVDLRAVLTGAPPRRITSEPVGITGPVEAGGGVRLLVD